MGAVVEPDPVLVVGAGGSGMVAALRAAQLGATVLVLEKDLASGCNTGFGGGLVQGAGTRYQRAAGIEDSPEAMHADIMGKNGGAAEADVVMAICRRSADVVHFLADTVGLEVHLDRNVRYYGHSAYRMHAGPEETGAEVAAALRAAIAAHPRITVVDHARVTGLLERDGRVAGVRTADPRRSTVPAASVLLACDGFGADRAMLERHCPEIATATYIGAPNNTGDALRWAVEVGAALDRMTAYQGHAHVNPGTGTRLGGGLPGMGSILVNADGRRFEREDQGYSEFARVVLAQPGGVALEVFDQRIFDLAWSNGAFRAAHAAGVLARADTAEALADHFGVPAAALAEEIADFNRAARDGGDRLGRSDHVQPLVPPLWGARVTGAMVHTQGGVRIDPRARALRSDDVPIEGLYASGGTAAGMSGDGPEGYMSGNGLAHAFGTGLIAGEEMVRRAERRL